ncbi:Arsenate reductase [compost metagenome]
MKVLFLCTANSCRSILSEALFNHLAPVGLRAYSAGSHPSGRVHPLSLRALERAGVSTAGLSSKGNEAHAALAPDLVVTVCDQAAGEACPAFFGPALKVHWGLVDPSAQAGDAAQVEAAFDATLAQIRRRVEAFLALPLDRLEGDRLKAELARIGTL